MSSSSPGYGGGKIKAKETRHRWVPLSVIARLTLSVIAGLAPSVIARHGVPKQSRAVLTGK